jgi:hypothetical protein
MRRDDTRRDDTRRDETRRARRRGQRATNRRCCEPAGAVTDAMIRFRRYADMRRLNGSALSPNAPLYSCLYSSSIGLSIQYFAGLPPPLPLPLPPPPVPPLPLSGARCSPSRSASVGVTQHTRSCLSSVQHAAMQLQSDDAADPNLCCCLGSGLSGCAAFAATPAPCAAPRVCCARRPRASRACGGG